MPCPNDHRKRLVTVGFRVTEEQARRIDDLVAASGMTKQDYIMKRLECDDVVVMPSSRLYRALREGMELVYRELAWLAQGESPDERIIKLAELLAAEFVALRADECDAGRDALLGIERSEGGGNG